MDQDISFCTTADGVRLAYSVIGRGPPLVRTGNWLTHLGEDLDSPVWRHVTLGLASRCKLLRYDARGVGLSQRDIAEVSFTRLVEDVEAVTEAAGFTRFALLGISQGVGIAIAYALRHPERVSHLILYGGYARGVLRRDDPALARDSLELDTAMIRQGWGRDNEAYRMFFTSQFMPDATAEQCRWFNEMERVAATPEMAERILVELAETDLAAQLPRLQIPTLVLHCRGDVRVPFAESHLIASRIPGAKLVPLPGRNHLFLPNDPAHRAFLDAVAAFLGQGRFRGTLPGTASVNDRLDGWLKRLEQNWITKTVVLIAALTGVILFGVDVWRMLRR